MDVHMRAAGADQPAADANLADFAVDQSARSTTVMLATDRATLHAAWLPRLQREPGIQLQGALLTVATQLAGRVALHLPKVLLLDKALLDRLDPRSLRTIHGLRELVRVLLLSDEISHGVVTDVLRNRLHGFLLTSCAPETCLKAIQAVGKGELWLSRASLASAIADMRGLSRATDAGAGGAAHANTVKGLTTRELQIVGLVRRGFTNKEIGRELGIMEDTVKKHLQSVFAKLGVHRRALVTLRRRAAAA